MIETLKKDELIPLTFDVMFTEIFNDEKNICILEEFVSGYFNIQLEKVRGNLKIKSRRQKKESRFDSRKEVDLILDLNGEKINIEMSNSRSKGVINRNIVYLCKIHGGQLREGDETYGKIMPTIQINFNNYNCQEELKTVWYMRDEKGKILSEKLRIDIINLAKGKNLCYNGNVEDYLISWCKILTGNKKEKIEKTSERILSKESTTKLIGEMNKLSGDDEMVELYTKLSRREIEYNTYKEEAREEGFNQGVEQGIQQGIQQGIHQGIKQGNLEKAREIAKNMLEKGYNIEQILDITNLSRKEIEKINLNN